MRLQSAAADAIGRTGLGYRHAALAAGAAMTLGAISSGIAQDAPPPAAPLKTSSVDSALQAVCTTENLQAVATGLSTTVTIKKTENGPLSAPTKFFPATAKLPAFCQATGSFVTNPETGKTANFLATFPANWNGKYLQSGCSGHCGQFYVTNPTVPSVTVTSQGHPGQIIEKGYAHFATDEGHVGLDGAKWAIRKDGSVDQDFIDDFYFRADKVLADMGKGLTKAVYAKVRGKATKIKYAYFNGCSGGGRDALVAASQFPEKFDGIVAGSPYDILGVTMQSSGIKLAAHLAPNATVTPELLDFMDTIVKRQCDAADGVKDGVVQNPAACNFRPDRDLPLCAGDKPGGQCFTHAQVNTLSTILTAVTDEYGRVLQPGYSVSELRVTGGPGLDGLSDGTQTVFVHRNDPKFSIASNYDMRSGGPGEITAFRAVFSFAEYARLRAATLAGNGHIVENADRLMRSKTKLLMWHNLSDEALTPYMSINYYKALAKRFGGYANLQRKARLFMIPATAHCSITGNGPNSYDALGTIENWVEKSKAPESLVASVMARQYLPGAPPAKALQFPNWTQKLCKFPEMARYSGKGDLKDAANWSCSASDKRMLGVGESGRQAGVTL